MDFSALIIIIQFWDPICLYCVNFQENCWVVKYWYFYLILAFREGKKIWANLSQLFTCKDQVSVLLFHSHFIDFKGSSLCYKSERIDDDSCCIALLYVLESKYVYHYSLQMTSTPGQLMQSKHTGSWQAAKPLQPNRLHAVLWAHPSTGRETCSIQS